MPTNYGLLGANMPQGYASLLGNQDLALALLANSGYQPTRQTFGQTLGNSMLQAQQMGQQRDQDALRKQYIEAQIATMNRPDQAKSPASVQEYEYAKRNGYTGSFQDWIIAGGQSSRPSSVIEWEAYSKMSPDDQQRYLEMKRNPNFMVKEVNQAPTAIVGTPGGNFRATPLSTTASEAAAAGLVKGSEAQAGAVGKGLGDITTGIQKKGSDAVTVLGMTQEARKLLKESTGSAAGATVDLLAGGFGYSTKGAQAGAKLKVIQAALMTNMPRMEGPQSDRDVELYRQAAASIGDTTIPAETRAAALDTIDALQEKYKERAGSTGKVEDPLGIR